MIERDPESGFQALADAVGKALLLRGWMLATAESCTGGGIAATVTDVAGSSAWFERGFVTYSNRAKTGLLGVDARMIERHGAVSEAVVLAMVAGALRHSEAQIAVAVSGIAGPSGGSHEKPVGTVWLAWKRVGSPGFAERYWFDGDRRAVRNQAVATALQGVIDVCRTQPS